MKDKFISFSITDNMVYYNLNYYKYINYIVNFYNNNYKNDFNTIFTDINIKNDHIYSSCINSNINDRWQNLIL